MEAILIVLSQGLVIQCIDSLVHLLKPLVHISILGGVGLQVSRGISLVCIPSQIAELETISFISLDLWVD